MNAMSILSTAITIVFLGFLYWRMVKREIPQPVGWLQALLPIAIGLLSHPLTIPFSEKIHCVFRRSVKRIFPDIIKNWQNRPTVSMTVSIR